MGLSQLGTSTGTRLIGKVDMAGQTVLPSTTTNAGPTTSASNNTFGSWAQVTASTSAEYLLVGVVAWQANLSTSGALTIEVGTGGAGLETTMATVAIGDSVPITGSSSTGNGGHVNLAIPLRISSGTRLAVRAALVDPSGSARNCGVKLLVVSYANVEGN